MAQSKLSPEYSDFSSIKPNQLPIENAAESDAAETRSADSAELRGH